MAAVIGALVGSATTLVWEGFLKPRQERKSIAAALNAEIGFNIMMLDRHLRGARDLIPPDFAAATTVYRSLAARLGELPPDLAFLLANHYSALEEANTLRDKCSELDTKRLAGGPYGSIILGQQQKMSQRFFALLGLADASAKLCHSALVKIAPSVQVQLSPPDASSTQQ